MTMTKAEMIAEIAEKTGIPQQATRMVFDESAAFIVRELANGDGVLLPGIGTLKPHHRTARPRTCAEWLACACSTTVSAWRNESSVPVPA